MDVSDSAGFPCAFGGSPEVFLSRYEALIYKVIFERTRNDPRFEAEDLFHDFFIHLAEDDFRRLRSYRGECQPTTYLGKILRNYLCDRYRKREMRVYIGSIEEMAQGGEQITTDAHPEDAFTGGLIRDALQAALGRLTTREQLLFDLFMDGEMGAREIADLIGVTAKVVYKNSEKVKRLLREELHTRGIDDV
jgi:RNA polymerase sigma factor (sigma-70 family)